MKFLLENTEVISIGRTTVLKNPSDRDYTQLEREQRRLHPNVAVWEPLLRRTYGEKGNTYVWPAFDATHRDIEWELYKRYGERTNQGKNWDLFDHYYLESLNEDVELSNEYDNEKNKLTKEQIEFFKYSKIRDSQDRLLVCYHGTPNEFDIFDNSKSLKGILEGGLYFTSNKQTGSAYGEKGRVLSVYLNITGYLDLTNYSKDYIQDVIEHIPEDQLELGDKYNVDRTSGFYFVNLANMVYKHNSSYKTACDVIEGWGYDGVKQDDETYIAFHSNQIKSISNQSPTGSNNINERLDINNFKYKSDNKFIGFGNFAYIDRNGEYVNGNDVGIHNDLAWELIADNGMEDYTTTKEDDSNSTIMGELGWVAIRCDTFEGNKISLMREPTSYQYDTLLSFIDYCKQHNTTSYLMVYIKRTYKEYDLEKYTSDEIVDFIKQYFITGRLEESFSVEESVTKIDNNKSIATLKDGTKFNIWTEMTDAYDNQLDFTKIAYVGDNWIDENDKIINKNILGYVQYSVYNNHAYVQMIEVKESMRRKGVATALMQSLYSDYKKVNWGMTTDDGTKFKRAYSNNINEDLDKPDITQDQWRTVSKLNMVNDIRHYGDLIHLELTDRWGNAIYIGNVTYDALVERVGKTIADIIKHKLDIHEPQVYYYEIYNILNKYRKFFKQDDNKLYLQAKEHFGTTSNPKLAGYLNVDGSLLDFSWGQGYRGTDHREIDQIMDDYSGSEAMYHYMNLGNIRVKPETPGIEIIVEPTKEQYGMIDRLATYFVYRENNFYLDISDKDGYNVGSVEYNKGDIHNIVYDIQNYFKTGKLPVNIED